MSIEQRQNDQFHPNEASFQEAAELSMSLSLLPAAEVLVENDLSSLREITDEVKQKVRFLFVLAHPDDEATHLIYIKLLQELGFPVHILWLTYGDGSTDITTKMRESEKVLSALKGVKYEFLPNKVLDVIQKVFKGGETQRRDMLTKIIDQVREKIEVASIIVTNAFEGGHILHDFTHVVARTIAEELQKEVLEIPQYSLKTPNDMLKSVFRAASRRHWGTHMFWNVADFREGCEDGNISLSGDGKVFHLPKKLRLTPTGIASKAGLIRMYQSQWESVFTHLLEVVEFNGTEGTECIRRAREIPSLYGTTMHIEKVIKSWLGMMVPPKRLYRAKSEIESLVKARS